MGGGPGGGGIYCLVEVPQGCSCQVNILQCTLEGVKTVVDKNTLGGSLGGGYLSVFVWVVRSCLAVSVFGCDVLVGIDV